MDALKLLNAVPYGELIRVQKTLGLSANQVWYIATYWAATAESDTDISDLTGVSRSTIRDIRMSLISSGLFSDEHGFSPLITRLAEMRGGQGGIAPIQNSTPLIESLDAYEQLLILDHFTCRVCFTKWDMNRIGGPVFRIRKVAEGASAHASRAIICSNCVEAAETPDMQEKLRLYITARSERLHAMRGHCITQLEHDMITQITAKNSGPVATKPDLVATNAPLTELKEHAPAPATFPTRVDTDASTPTRQAVSVLDSVDSDEAFVSSKNEETKGGSRNATPPYIPKSQRKGISSCDEEDTDELENAEHPKTPPGKRENKASKKAQDMLARNSARLEALKHIPYEEWSSRDMVIYYWDAHRRKYGYAQGNETIAERQKHINDILLSLDGSIAEFIKFTTWIMATWHTLPFVREDVTPTTRNVAIRLGDLLPHYHGGTKRFAMEQTKANPHIDATPPEVPDWVVNDKPEDSNGKKPKLKLPEWAGKRE